jgi:pyruvate formate lyase activating enzyme
MIIGGLQKFSLIDYPGKISAIVFTRGCNFRCPYCHNPELVDPQRYAEPWQEEEFWAFLQSRTQKLDAVVVTGGEPTLQEGLQPFLERIRKMGFLIKLDTNGSNPDVLKDLLSANLVDYIAMDIKAPLEKYSEVAKVSIDKTDIEESIELIKQSNVDHEFLTTIAKNVLSKEDVVNIAKMLQGEKLYILQRCIPTKILDPLFFAQFEPYTHEELEQMANLMKHYVLQCLVR